jgi:hypothetical protein
MRKKSSSEVVRTFGGSDGAGTSAQFMKLKWLK